jgi:hypothetical protein
VAFHVEISQAMRHARVFNLNNEDLIAKIVEPWLEDRVIEMGDREWRPGESKLRILDGPQMEPPDLSFGQGWSNAERKSEDVTAGLLKDAPPLRVPDAFVIEVESPEAVTAELIGDSGRAIQWREAKEKIDDRDPEIAAVILVMRKAPR